MNVPDATNDDEITNKFAVAEEAVRLAGKKLDGLDIQGLEKRLVDLEALMNELTELDAELDRLFQNNQKAIRS